MTAEDKIHWGVLLVLAGLASLMFVAQPAEQHTPQTSRAAPPDAPLDSAALTREELEDAISSVLARVEGWQAGPNTALESSLRLHGLGRAGLDPREPPARAMAALFSGWRTSAATPLTQPASAPASVIRPLPARDSQHALDENDPVATLSILLEAGVAFDQELPLDPAPSSLRQLVETALGATEPARLTHDPDPWELDLLAWATLGGLEQYREDLGRATQLCLTRLDRRQRTWNTGPGNGVIEPEDVARMADSWQEPEERAARLRELQLAAVVFRAVAVLGETELERQAQRYLNSLAFRYHADRALYEHLLSKAATAAERTAIRVDAIENLGRLEQALYGAHLNFRSRERPEPAPRTAALMRQAARDLRDQLQPLLREGALQALPTDSPEARSARLRAAVHALRGLRAARVANSPS
jgi:hypothetical protein